MLHFLYVKANNEELEKLIEGEPFVAVTSPRECIVKKYKNK